MIRWIAPAMAALAMAAASPPASAAVVTVEYVGQVSGGADLGPLFGSFGNLVGKPVTTTFTFDPAAPGATASITMNGVTEPVSDPNTVTSAFGDLDLANGLQLQILGPLWLGHPQYSVREDFAQYKIISATPTYLHFFETGPVSSQNAGIILLGEFTLNQYLTTLDIQNTDLYVYGALPNYNGPFLPEPTTWSFMMVGIGAAGGALRQQRRALRTT